MGPHRVGRQQTVVQLCFSLFRIEIPKLVKRHSRNTFLVFDIETEYLYLHLRGVRRNDYSKFYQLGMLSHWKSKSRALQIGL